MDDAPLIDARAWAAENPNTAKRSVDACRAPIGLTPSSIEAHQRRQEILISHPCWPVQHWYSDEDFCRAFTTAVALQAELVAARAENARYRQALEHIAANGCERLTGDRKIILCKKNYIKGAPYGSDAWCDACWAMEALGTEPLVPAISRVGMQRIILDDRIRVLENRAAEIESYVFRMPEVAESYTQQAKAKREDAAKLRAELESLDGVN